MALHTVVQNENKNSSRSKIIFESESESHTTIVFPSPERHFDVLSQFRANLKQLENLNSRLQFILNEVSTLIAKK